MQLTQEEVDDVIPIVNDISRRVNDAYGQDVVRMFPRDSKLVHVCSRDRAVALFFSFLPTVAIFAVIAKTI